MATVAVVYLQAVLSLTVLPTLHRAGPSGLRARPAVPRLQQPVAAEKPGGRWARRQLLQWSVGLGAAAPANAAGIDLGWLQGRTSRKQLKKELLQKFDQILPMWSPEFSTAESLLLARLPIQCPPLDALRAEIEEFYVLRDESVDWDSLRISQAEAWGGISSSKPLFRLFFDRLAIKRGDALVNRIETLVQQLEGPLRNKCVA